MKPAVEMSDPAQGNAILEWGVASQALPGEATSGDLHLVAEHQDGMMAAVVDGLGHGHEATVVARQAIEFLKENADQHIIWLAEHCHAALRTTRGAVMTVVKFNRHLSTVAMLGIGNVETVLLRADPAASPSRENVLLRGGVVGYQLPSLHASVFPVHPGDLVIFATDGVRPGFADQVNLSDPLQPMAERVLEQNFRGTDDALVLAIRYLGPSRG
jgi:phosphoserine phosphatase RsbX